MGKNKNEYDYEELYFDTEENEPETKVEPEFGCGFCWDKRKRHDIELWFIDRANNMRVCSFCPSCGRKLG